MKKFRLALLISVFTCLVSNSYSQDTIKLFFYASETFQLSAPQKYYKDYEWQFPNSPTIFEKTISLNFLNAGTFYVNCYAHDSCYGIDSTVRFQIDISDSNSINDPITDLIFFPNPITNNIGPKLIVNSIDNNIPVLIKILNSAGSLLLNRIETINYGTTLLDYSTDFAGQGAGQYFLNFISNGTKKTFLFIKQ